MQKQKLVAMIPVTVVAVKNIKNVAEHIDWITE
jgi:hypothetical protein